MFIAIEGIDGSGKGTQTRLLQARAQAEGLKVAHLSFPQYGKNAFAEVVAEYLNGAFGTLDEVHPKHLSKLLMSLQDIVRKSPNTRVFLTGRPHIDDRSRLSALRLKIDQDKPRLWSIWHAKVKITHLPWPIGFR